MTRGGQRQNHSFQQQKNVIHCAHSSRHRLLSIQYDVHHFLKYVILLHWLPSKKNNSDRRNVVINDVNDEILGHKNQANKQNYDTSDWTIFSNERCGSWYAHPFSTSSCYFKSTDGHKGTWNFSLKRLNLSLLHKILDNHPNMRETLDENNSNNCFGCLIVDASHSKIMPDAFSRTIPIWAAVLNRVIYKLREQKEPRIIFNDNVSNSNNNTDSYSENKETQRLKWDTNLYTPLSCVTKEEHNAIESILDKHVDSVLSSGVLLDPDWLINNVTKPLKPYWITNNGSIPSSRPTYSKEYISIVCVSCSNMKQKLMKMTSPITNEFPTDTKCNEKEYDHKEQFSWYYSPGAGDDHESWSHGLTPSLFWSYRSSILELTPSHHNNSNNIFPTKTSLADIDKTKLAIGQITTMAKFDTDNDNYLRTADERQRVMLEVFGKSIYCSIYGQLAIINDLKLRSKKDMIPSNDYQNMSNSQIEIVSKRLASASMFKNNHKPTLNYFVPKEKMDISEYYSIIGGTNIAIGSRRASRPPQCWDHFDAIINVSMNEYSDLFPNDDAYDQNTMENKLEKDKTNQNHTIGNISRFYIQMPVLEGKRDRTELEKWMTIAMTFIVGHTNERRKILIHCAQGKDRSVAVAMAAIALLYEDKILHVNSSLEIQQKSCNNSTMGNVTNAHEDIDKRKSSHALFPSWSLKPCFDELTFQEMESRVFTSCMDEENPLNDQGNTKSYDGGKKQLNNVYKRSGMSNCLVQKMMGREGRDMFFAWINDLNQTNSFDNIDKTMSNTLNMPTKESLRRILHFIQIFREIASPTRNTMQKLNRYLMSSSHEKNISGKSNT